MKERSPLWETVRKVGGDAVILALLSMGLIALLMPDSRIITAEITARIPGTDFAGWDEQGLRRYDAPQVPAPAATYLLTDLDDLDCGRLYVPEAAWAKVPTAWPDYSVMYTVNAYVSGGAILIDLRSRQGYGRGYAYVEVMALCRLVPEAILGRVLWEAIGGSTLPEDVQGQAVE